MWKIKKIEYIRERSRFNVWKNYLTKCVIKLRNLRESSIKWMCERMKQMNECDFFCVSGWLAQGVGVGAGL